MQVCDANAMGGMGALGAIGGSIGSFMASRAQAQMYRALGKAQRQAAEAAASISEQNAAITEQASEVEADRGAVALSTLKSKGRQAIASQRAAIGASGLASTSGTPALILEDTAVQLATDVDALRLNNRRSQWGYDVQALNYRNQANQHSENYVTLRGANLVK